MFKQSTVLVGVLVLGLAAVALAEHKVRPISCGTCKSLVALVKELPAQVKIDLKQICKYCDTKANTKKCEQVADQAKKELHTKSVEEICQELTFCKKPSLSSLLRY